MAMARCVPASSHKADYFIDTRETDIGMTLPQKRGADLKRNTLAVLTALLVAGCGSSTKPTTVVPLPTAQIGLPTPPAAGPVNTYSGAQSPGAWTFTLDNSKNAFSYQPLTYPATPNQPATGSLQTSGGFTSLSGGGLAYEVLGRAAVLSPGVASSPVFGVPQTECYVIGGKMRFQYIAMIPGLLSSGLSSIGPTLGYGSIVASTDTTGKNWQFENLQGNIVAGPVSFTGTCASANGQASIPLTGPTVLDTFWQLSDPLVLGLTPGTQSELWVGPSGFLAADQSDPTQSFATGASIAGMAEPTSPLATSALAATQYLGILYEPPINGFLGMSTVMAPAYTVPVGFGQVVAGSGTTLTGGVFPNDNVTGTPNSDTIINLGAQDGTLNGLYTSVKITVLDPAQNCANFASYYSIPNPPLTVTSGVNALGFITCTFPGIAIAGNPDGNYAIFVSTYNFAAYLGGVPMQIYLFQH
jgi:hypothetical protein